MIRYRKRCSHQMLPLPQKHPLPARFRRCCKLLRVAQFEAKTTHFLKRPMPDLSDVRGFDLRPCDPAPVSGVDYLHSIGINDNGRCFATGKSPKDGDTPYTGGYRKSEHTPVLRGQLTPISCIANPEQNHCNHKVASVQAYPKFLRVRAVDLCLHRRYRSSLLPSICRGFAVRSSGGTAVHQCAVGAVATGNRSRPDSGATPNRVASREGA